MTTLVGTQSNFLDAIIDLIKLEYDAVEAYKAALERLENSTYIQKLTEFTKDHERHISVLTQLVKKHGAEAPEGPDGKQYLTKGKVMLANLISSSDEAILGAMRSNEIDTNTAYDRMQDYKDIWPDGKDFIKSAFEDEKRHKAWLDSTLGL